MSKDAQKLVWILGCVALSRMVAMAFIPLMDTSEPRYAEMARIMAETGDWVTPYFDYGVPFWGKPPLAFWCQALAFKLFGVGEFAARLPALLATAGVVSLIYVAGRQLANARVALMAMLIYCTSALGYAGAGAVLTDPFLTLGTTGVLVAALLTMERDTTTWWRYGPFLGMAVGLLAKGPSVLVLAGIPLFGCLVSSSDRRARLAKFPWLMGSMLTLALTLPWYIAAELKTPGFLDYFMLGEHFKRFVDPGWSGDLYGTAHQRVRGTIWWYALQASFPWGLVAAAVLWRPLTHGDLRFDRSWFASGIGLLWSWTLWPLLFFTLAGNILWTYVQPTLPALALLLALALERRYTGLPRWWGTVVAVIPLGILSGTLMLLAQPNLAKTERLLVQRAEVLSHGAPAPLIYIGQAPFSARFYSSGKAESVPLAKVDALLNNHRRRPFFLAINKDQSGMLATRMNATPVYENRRYALFHFARRSSHTVAQPLQDKGLIGERNRD